MILCWFLEVAISFLTATLAIKVCRNSWKVENSRVKVNIYPAILGFHVLSLSQYAPYNIINFFMNLEAQIREKLITKNSTLQRKFLYKVNM